MFRRSIPDDYALAFQFGSTKTRDLHMLFVFFPIDAIWIVDGVVRRVETLRPWRGFAREEANLIVELPAGTATDVEPGDRLASRPSRTESDRSSRDRPADLSRHDTLAHSTMARDSVSTPHSEDRGSRGDPAGCEILRRT